jgi:hypothetical protein
MCVALGGDVRFFLKTLIIRKVKECIRLRDFFVIRYVISLTMFIADSRMTL